MDLTNLLIYGLGTGLPSLAICIYLMKTGRL